MEKDALDFIDRVQKITISDLGKRHVEKLERESRGDEVKRYVFQTALGKLEAERGKLEAEAKLAGTYLEDCDGLWNFTRQMLPLEGKKRLELFDKISRKELRKCYKEIGAYFDDLDPVNLPDPSMKSLGSASFNLKDSVDIFNNEWNNERAHLIPDSPTCAPKWGHSAEGAFRPLAIESAKKNDARRLLVMGCKGTHKLRKKPQNFIKFAAHKEVYDVNPCVMIIPIMHLDDVLNKWEDDDSYEALVIASEITKPERTEPSSASSTYKQILHHFIYNDENFCSPEDITTATGLIHDFLLGHAGSLAAGIPMDIDPDRSTDEKREVLEELETARRDIINNGVALPLLHEGKVFRKVLKVRFAGEDGAPIPDPWLLAAKAAVNLSSTRGQKLLPTCKQGEEEDYELLQEIHEYQKRRRQTKLPVEVNFCEIGEMPDTPPQANRSSAVVVTPPQEGGDDWENFGD